MAAREQGYPSAEGIRATVETVADGPVECTETGYGYSCHVADVDSAAGTTFVAIDANRQVPQVYFDAAAARGRRVVSDAQRGVSFAYVIERLLSGSAIVEEYLRTHRERYAAPMVTDGGLQTGEVSGHPLEDPTTQLQPWLRAAYHRRCQYLHRRRAERDGGPLTAMLEAFERPPLTNDKLGQQFGWRMAAREAREVPDLALELVVFASHRQVRDALSE